MSEKLESASADLERLREEKDEEIMILQEGVDSTLQKMADIQAVMPHYAFLIPRLIIP
jgi:hypothetical protein